MPKCHHSGSLHSWRAFIDYQLCINPEITRSQPYNLMMNRNGSTRMLQLYLIAFAALFVEVSTGFSFIGRTSPSSTYRRFKPTLLRALRVTIHIRGKGRGGEKWLETAYEQYEERLKPSGLDLVTVNLKENVRLTSQIGFISRLRIWFSIWVSMKFRLSVLALYWRRRHGTKPTTSFWQQCRKKLAQWSASTPPGRCSTASSWATPCSRSLKQAGPGSVSWLAELKACLLNFTRHGEEAAGAAKVPSNTCLCRGWRSPTRLVFRLFANNTWRCHSLMEILLF